MGGAPVLGGEGGGVQPPQHVRSSSRSQPGACRAHRGWHPCPPSPPACRAHHSLEEFSIEELEQMLKVGGREEWREYV